MNNLSIRTRFAIIAIITVLLSVGLSSGIILMIMRNDIENQARAFQDTKLKVFHHLIDQKGKAHMDKGNLVFGDYIANNNHEVVDRMKELAGGTATIFMGDTRVSTNVQKEDGSRAVGTTLQGVARETVLNRATPFRGDADILGVSYYTAYDPILDEQGKPVGVLYVGLKKSDFLAAVNKSFMVAGVVGLGLTILFVGLILVSVSSMLKEIVRLTKVAEEISVGNALADPIVSDRGDELKALAMSFERLRKSMKAALERLG
jgi:methyl-accepting chemotaxis protein